MVRSAGEEQYAGCTGVPADSHNVIWLGVCFDQHHDSRYFFKTQLWYPAKGGVRNAVLTW
jgi:hypothetical protein